jgi:hypothetical protein
MKPTAASAFKRGPASEWTPERLERLGKQELLNLQENAVRLGEEELAGMCARLLKKRPKRGS